MKRMLLLISLGTCGLAVAVSPDAATFGPPGNPEDQIRAFWHPTVSFYTNLFENGFNALIVHHMGEYNVRQDCCPNANIPADRNRWLDICQERGIAFVEKLTLTEGFARAGTFPLKTAKGTEKGGHADATNPDFLVACSNALAKILAQYPDHPAVFGVQASSEVRDHAAPADQPWFRERYRKATGREVPAGAENRNPPMYDQIDDFPVGRIVGPDYPLWTFYRWWWKDGDGWNAYQTAMARQFAAHFSHPVAAFYDPVVRTPPIWGSGGDVTFGNQWTYPYSQPYKVLYVVSEQQAMARGNPGQGVTTMLQGISYRSAIAPKEETPAVHPKWHDEFPNTSYPTTPAALMREGVWSALARRIDGIMFFAGAALFDLSSEAKDYDEYRKRAYYQHCDPETMPVVNGIFRDVAVPLGPLLRAVPERPMEVAVLESAPSVVFARTGTWGAGSDVAVAAAGAGLQPQTLYDEDIARDGIPTSLKVLLLPKCAVMEETTVRAIRDWQVRTDGVVLADGDLVPAILPDGALPEIAAETEGVACAAAFRAGGGKLLEVLAPSYRPYASATADIIPYVRTWKNADYVFAINDRRGYGDYVGAWKRVLDKGLPNKGVVRVNRTAGAVYDLVRHVAVPFTVKDGVTEIPVEYKTNDGRILLMTSRPLGALTVSVENGTVTVTSSDRDVMIPIEISRADKRPYYAVVRDGVFSRKLGVLKGFVVRNLATGEEFR